ncbi:cell division protein FtsQ/DivIB [Arcicella rosea]|uniref:Cell division protein FtsQ n=1 Tax=Arcicella rosea TaxID=502909 RepID=A0A841EVN9_9BACT|nr:FtsQ-type POTRA domain-containing protein [Arcicella rosea]MBB6005123.1 cell division protein FtsQ [Arcicella rosea]
MLENNIFNSITLNPLRKIKKWIWPTVLTVVLLSIVIYAENVHHHQKCKNINVNIEGANESQLVTPDEILAIVSPNVVDSPEGKPFDKIDFKKIEKRVCLNKLVKSCQVHRDLSGEMTIDIVEHTPLARVLYNKSSDSYVTEKGDFIGISQHFTPRVLLLSGRYFDKIQDLKEVKSKPVLDLINAINVDPFWKAQITQLIVEKDGGITMVPEIGNHVIEFGMGIDIESKFKKIKFFYKDILPAKGWDTYHKVSVKYRNQIICE